MLWMFTLHSNDRENCHTNIEIKICALHRLHYHIIHLNMQPFHRTVKWMEKWSCVMNDEESMLVSYHFHNFTFHTGSFSCTLPLPFVYSFALSLLWCSLIELKKTSRNWIYYLTLGVCAPFSLSFSSSLCLHLSFSSMMLLTKAHTSFTYFKSDAWTDTNRQVLKSI